MMSLIMQFAAQRAATMYPRMDAYSADPAKAIATKSEVTKPIDDSINPKYFMVRGDVIL
jgi:hypothetical protein